MTDAFHGKPWLWCNIQNFGDITFIGGPLGLINKSPHGLREKPQAGKLVGLGIACEGLGNNPVIFEMMFETAWRDRPVDCGEWVAEFARRRYGSQNARAQDAWQHLYRGVYGGGGNGSLVEAWRALLDAADELEGVDTYRFDLVHVARQVLSERRERSKGPDREQITRDMDRLLATRKEFLLGRWLADARRWGDTDEERAKMEWNARRVITMWGATKRLNNYARKEWSGLLAGYYLPVEQKKLDPNEWSGMHEEYPTESQGDSVRVAKELWEERK
jgi:alpha-N-acetylglucosaminidase